MAVKVAAAGTERGVQCHGNDSHSQGRSDEYWLLLDLSLMESNVRQLPFAQHVS
jgi:hypothetical protein